MLPDALQEFVTEVCTRLGAEQDIAEVVAEHLIRANQSGHDSHGVARLPGYTEDDARGRVAGVWLAVIDPGMYGDRDDYAASVQETIAAIRRSTPAGVRVRIPGERRLGVPLEQA